MRHDKWLALAIKVARANPHPEFKLAAVLVEGGSVQSVGINSYRQKILPPDAVPVNLLGFHAEAQCLKQLGCRPVEFRNLTLYVARVTPGGKVGLSLPCVDCHKKISLAKIKTVVYTDPMSDAGYGILKPQGTR